MADKISTGETPMVSYRNIDGVQMFLLTKKQTPTKESFYLYEIAEDGSLKKLGRGNTPPELEAKFCVTEKLSEISCKKKKKKL